jgi:hypothetical protein
MFFSKRREIAPTPEVMRRLAHKGDADALPPDKYLVESTQLLENMQGALNICFERSKRQLEVLSFGGQRPEPLELFRAELAGLHAMIEEMSALDPPFSPIEVGRQLRAFAKGDDL